MAVPFADVRVDANGVKTGNADFGDEMEIMMLGAGQEVGRSCCVIKYKGATVVCDAGSHPAYQGLPALPFVDELDWSTVDAILVSHFHVDHAASLPYVMEKTNFRDGGGYVYMTQPTKDVYSFLIRDFVRISITSSAVPSQTKLYDENDLDESFKSIRGVSFYEEVFVPPRSTPLDTTIASTSSSPIKFTSYPAGHVLGAAMFLIEIAGARILYTGDYSTEEDRHLIPASVPNWGQPPDVMICESTFGVQTLEPRPDKELRFTTLVRNIVKRGGKVLMPVFALGRAQELLLILDEFWDANPDLHQFPIYYVSAMAAKCMKVYKTHTSSLNANIQQQAANGEHPFDFGRGRHVRELKDVGKRFDDSKPCVVLAVPGMLQNGVSRQLLERWAPDSRNGLVLCGYSVEGTMARIMQQQEPEEFQSMEGKKIHRRMSVDYISFAAHVDYTQNSRFINEVNPAHLLLCHGEYNNVARLKSALKKSYADRKQDVQIYSPANTENVKIKLARTRIARAVGSLATADLSEGAPLAGLLVAKDANYTLLAPSDLEEYTGLSTSFIRQTQRMRVNVGWDVIKWHLESMYGKLKAGKDDQGVTTLRVMNAVDVKQPEQALVVLEWIGGSTSDMIADSVLALLLGIDRSPATVKLTAKPHSHSHVHDKKPTDTSKLDPETVNSTSVERLDLLIAFLHQYFGNVELLSAQEMAVVKAAEEPPEMEDGEAKVETEPEATAATLKVTLDDKIAYVPLDTMVVSCTHEGFRQRLEGIVSQAVEAATPLYALAAKAEAAAPKKDSS